MRSEEKEIAMTQSTELSSREWEVVNQLLEGKSNKEIAAALHISVRTVEFHLKNVYDKLQVGSRTELILKLGQSTVCLLYTSRQRLLHALLQHRQDHRPRRR